MKVESTRISQTNSQHHVEFKISSDAGKIFSMLGQYLYSDKEYCVLYELSTNAADEHKTCGKADVPFRVTLPTQLDQFLRIRDFGRGLDEQNVYSLLCTYGASEKNTSNEVVGGWGIGFKSVAAVSDNWTVKSFHGGSVKEYLIFIGSNGIPQITKIAEHPTDETGIEIIIPVKSDRTSHWKYAVDKCYKHFSVFPEVKNHLVTFKPFDFGNNFWQLFPSSYAERLKIITSSREYSVDKSKFAQEFTNKKLADLCDLPMYVKFDIGEVELSISREAIQYTKPTLAAIEAKFQKIYDEIKSQLDTSLSVAKDGLEYRTILSTSHQTMFKGISQYTYSGIVNVIIAGNVFGLKAVSELDYWKCDINHKVVTQNNTRFFYKERLTRVKPGFNGLKTHYVSTSETVVSFSIKSLPKLLIVEADIKNAASRLRGCFDEKFPTKNHALIVNDASIFPDSFKSYVVKASSLPKAVRSKTEKVKVKSPLYKKYGKKAFCQCSDSTLDTDKSFYVVLKNVVSGQYTDQQKYQNVISFLEPRGYTVYGIKENSVPPQGLLPVDEFCKKLINEFSKTTSDAALSAAVSSYDYRNTPVGILIKAAVKTRMPSILNEAIDEYLSLLSRKSKLKTDYDSQLKYELYQNLTSMLGIANTCENPQEKMSNYMKLIYNEYEMLKMLNWSALGSSSIPKVISYIESVEKSKETK